MKSREVELKPPPRFVTDRRGRTKRVSLETAAYLTLLVRGNVTDPSLWPPGLKRGAGMLARIRAIEHRCIRKLGHFDWEKLSPKVQDEYDGLCVDLDAMLDTGEWKELREFLRRQSRRTG